MPPKPSEKRMQHFREMLAYDQAHLGFGASLAGMDEVGRGPLVGDVVTACVILPAEPVFPWVDDSKKLSAVRREEVYAQIMEHALYVGIGRASARENFNPLSPHGERQQTHTTFRREKLAHLHNIVSFRQQRGSSC